MNSCRSRLLFACAPPLMTFIMGTGICVAAMPPKYRYSGSPDSSAAARATAIDTASIALAPSRDLFSVPSRSISVRSKKACSQASRPSTASEISVLMNSTALSTPLPRYRLMSPSRSSIASRDPVEAPDGTAARPMVPLSSSTSHSTVGLPRESRISRPTISTIALIYFLQNFQVVAAAAVAPRCRWPSAIIVVVGPLPPMHSSWSRCKRVLQKTVSLGHPVEFEQRRE